MPKRRWRRPTDEHVDTERVNDQPERNGDQSTDHSGDSEPGGATVDQVVRQRSGDRHQQTRRGGDECGKGAAGQHGHEQICSRATEQPRRQGQHERVGLPGGQQVGGVGATQHAIERREDVVRAEQRQHGQCGFPRRAAVGVV